MFRGKAVVVNAEEMVELHRGENLTPLMRDIIDSVDAVTTGTTSWLSTW